MGLFSWSPAKIEKTFQKGKDYYKQRFFALARDPLTKAAEHGHAEAQYTLGIMFLKGLDVHASSYEALRWFEMAAEQGHREAQYEAARIYAFKRKNTSDREADGKKAFYWFSKAAEQGHKEAQYWMGYYFWEGIHTKKNKSRALEWFLKIGEQDSLAAVHCAAAYFEGWGTKKDYSQAFKWYLLAAEKFHNSEAYYYCGLCYFKGLGTEQDYGKALEWFQKSPEYSPTVRYYYLGQCYANGRGTERDADKALGYYIQAMDAGVNGAEKAADQLMKEEEGPMELMLRDNPSLQFQHGMDYSKEKKDERALYWYLKSAKQGYATAQFACGVLYHSGRGTPANVEKAFYWYEKAAEQGDMDAQFACGWMYSKGEGVCKDEEKELEWYLKAAEQGEMTAQYNCAVIYHNRKYFSEAEKRLEIVAESGNEELAKKARKKLKELKEDNDL